MDRDSRRDDRRRQDTRDHKPRYEKDRSRSPPRRERNEDRRRDRSPFRGPPRGASSTRGGRDPGRVRGRDGPSYSERPPPRQALDSRPNGAAPRVTKQTSAPEVNMEIMDDEDEEAAMNRVMGFNNFRSTKNTKVPGNDKNYGVNKTKKAEYRQYMNRVGGFNRPLSPSRT